MARIDAELWGLVSSGGLKGDIDARIAAAVRDLEGTRAELVGMRDALRAGAEMVATEIARVDRLLRHAGVTPPAAKRRARNGRPNLSDDLLVRARAALEGSEPRAVAEIAEAAGMPATVAGRAVALLRERGEVRAVGGGRYRLFDDGGGDGD